MPRLRLSLAALGVLLWCSVPNALHAATIATVDLKRELHRYDGKLLLLSTASPFDVIHFDAQAHVTRESSGHPWTTAGLVKARKVDVHEGQVTIDGLRAVVAIDSQSPEKQLVAVTVDRTVHITIELPTTIHNPAELHSFLAKVFSTEGLSQKIENAWRPDVDLSRLANFNSLPSGGRLGMLDNSRPVYSWESGAVTKPKAYYKPGPQYAESAVFKRISGSIQVRTVVNEKGFPEILEVIQHLPGGLDAAVLAGVSQWRFQPALRNGVPAASVVIVEINFHLREHKAKTQRR